MYDQSDIFFVQDTAKFPFVLSWSCWYGILFILFFFKVNLIWLLSMTDLIYVLALGLLTLLYLTSSSLYVYCF